MPKQKVYVTTLQVKIGADSTFEAADAIHEIMQLAQEKGQIHDWGYIKIGEQFLYPSLVPGVRVERSEHDG